MSSLKGAPIRMGVAIALFASMVSSVAQSQQLAPQARDADIGSSYALRKTLLWYNRFIPQRAVYGAGYADFNRDGMMDVAVAPVNWAGGGAAEPLRIMMNVGGTFADQTATVLASQPGMVHARKLLVGDYNGDGWPDLFAIGHGYDVPPFPGEYPQLFLSNGDGTLRYDNSLQALVGFHHGGASGDVDHDGDIDILVVQQHHAFVLVNNGSGVFTKDPARMPAEAEWKNWFTGELLDADSDGHLDVVIGGHEFEDAPTTVYWGDGSGAFSAGRKTILPAIADKGIVLDYASEDIDGDGDRDMVVSRTGSSPFYSGRYLQVLVQSAARVFSDETGARISMVTTGNWIDYIRLQDINGDQIFDILHDDKNEMFNGEYAWINNGQGVFSPYTGTVKPAPELTVTDASTTEGQAGNKVLSFTIQSSQPPIEGIWVDLYTDNGTAAAGSDYVAAAIEGIAFGSGLSSASPEITIKGDGAAEGNETFTVITNAVGAVLRDGQGLGRILNDDLAGLSIADASVVEGVSGQATVRFEVSLSVPMPTPVSFDIATGNGSATAGSDYVARNLVGRVLDAGRTRQAFEVNVLGDALAEPDETFTVTIGNVVGATLADGSATGTISSDDAPAAKVLTINPASRGAPTGRAARHRPDTRR